MLFLLLLLLLPFVFVQVMSLSLEKLRLSPQVALLVMLGIFIGSVVNIPIKRIVRHEDVMTHPFPLFGFMDTFPHLQRVRRETVIAVNLGGCLIPTMVAVYEIWQLLLVSWTYLLIIGLAVAVNTAVCYWMAQPVKGIGIAMPALVPPLVAVLAALLLAPNEAPAVAFIAGAGTFDGIVLSEILAAYLA